MSAVLDLFPGTRNAFALHSDERYTPRHVFKPLDEEFRFTLDVCATKESAKCPRYYSKAEDGLAKTWAYERVWCNPPFSNILPWVERAWTSGADLVVMLVPAVRTEQPWWQDHIEPYRDGRMTGGFELTTRFLAGRISFGHPGNPEGAGVGSPMFGCVLLVWRQT